MVNDLVLVGYSSHAFVVIETLSEVAYNLLRYFDKESKLKNSYTLEYLAIENVTLIKNKPWFAAIGNNNIRKKIIEQYANQTTVIDKTANISSSAKIDIGTYINK